MEFNFDTHGMQVPHFDQYFGLWAILEEPFRAAADRLKGFDLRVHMDSEAVKAAVVAGSREAGDYEVQQGVALIDVAGTLMKQASSFSRGSSTVQIRQQIRNAVRNPDVAAIMLRVESPGGTVAGTQELADEIAAAAETKPVHAYIEDLGASAAFWLASQAQHVSANAMALVGSIGTYMVMHDVSGAAAQQGVKVHVIRAGAMKGAGTPGTEVTTEQLAEFQKLVDGFNSHFLDAVATGRKLPLATVQDLADGRIHKASAAMKLGLIDSVQTYDRAFQSLVKQSKRKAPMSTNANAENTPPAPLAASYQELVASCVGADDKFICAQLAAKSTLAQAVAAWMAEQNLRIAASKAETEAAQAKAAKPGVEALKTAGTAKSESNSDPVAQWNERLAAKVKAGSTKAKAAGSLAKEDPELHAAFIAASQRR